MRFRRLFAHSLLIALIAANPVLSSLAWGAHLLPSASCHTDRSPQQSHKPASGCCAGGCICHVTPAAEVRVEFRLADFGRIVPPAMPIERSLEPTTPENPLRPPIA